MSYKVFFIFSLNLLLTSKVLSDLGSSQLKVEG